MHELGILIQVIQRVETIAKQNQITHIEKLVLQIGELSAMIPDYIRACYPAAVEGTMLEKAELEIEILVGNGLCTDCQTVYQLIPHERTCPKCASKRFEVLSGKEFNIKEIVAY